MMRPNTALKVAVNNLLRVAASNASAARCQLVNAVLRASEATLVVTQAEMEDIDRDKLVRKVARFTKDVRTASCVVASMSPGIA